MLELIQKIKDYTDAGIILEHMELFDELEEKLEWLGTHMGDDMYAFRNSTPN